MQEQVTSTVSGLCACGCGQHTKLAEETNRSRGYVKGQPLRYVKGHFHNLPMPTGEKALNWKGGKRRTNGYLKVQQPNHSRTDNKGYVQEHILIAEKALGKPLPPKVQVHHFDKVRSNNANNNLVICQDAAYHSLLHQRLRALKACGNPHWRKCTFCKQYDDPVNMYAPQGHASCHHRKCVQEFNRLYRLELKTKEMAHHANNFA